MALAIFINYSLSQKYAVSPTCICLLSPLLLLIRYLVLHSSELLSILSASLSLQTCCLFTHLSMCSWASMQHLQCQKTVKLYPICADRHVSWGAGADSGLVCQWLFWHSLENMLVFCLFVSSCGICSFFPKHSNLVYCTASFRKVYFYTYKHLWLDQSLNTCSKIIFSSKSMLLVLIKAQTKWIDS